jgi:hypothetical protein
MIELIAGIGVGIVIGMYITSQIKCHIRRSIFKKNLNKYDKNDR